MNYWGLELGKGCISCDCNPQGSYFDQCNSQTGQCRCKSRVTGQKCDECIEGYYGLISLGECKGIQFSIVYFGIYSSRIMRKPAFCIYKNIGADQLHGILAADHAFVFTA